jgi:hypothetical protein
MDLPEPDGFWLRTGAARRSATLEHKGARIQLTVALLNRTYWVGMEWNPSRMIDPSGWSLFPLTEWRASVEGVARTVTQELRPVRSPDSWNVTRVDVARDFMTAHPAKLLVGFHRMKPELREEHGPVRRRSWLVIELDRGEMSMPRKFAFDDPRDLHQPPEMLAALQQLIEEGAIEPLLDEHGNQVWSIGRDGHPLRMFRSLIYRATKDRPKGWSHEAPSGAFWFARWCSQRGHGIHVANRDDVRPKKTFLSKNDPAAALAALQELVTHADDDQLDHLAEKDD